MKSWLLSILLLSALFLSAQKGSLEGKVYWKGTENAPELTEVILKLTPYKTKVQPNGFYQLKNIPIGKYTVITYTPGIKILEQEIEVVAGKNILNIEVDSVPEILDEFLIVEETRSGFGLMHLYSVDGMDIYAGKKNEVILLDEVNGNLATNNSRQVYSRVVGLNIWESDQAGLQLGIGGRGLSPNRTSNFNTRQNGYDIAADALGYPESYYTPPTEALQRIEVVRGAASLQYGTQFGGVLNFRLKEAPEDKKISLESNQTVGSYGLFSSFNGIGGTVKNTSYYAFANYKRGDGWRPNSEFDAFTGYASLKQKIGKKFSFKLEYTGMEYMAHQPGGLTDELFEEDPSQSIRERNWFNVNWNVMAVTLDYKFNAKWRAEMRNFGLIGSRKALGILGYINRPDPGGNRDLLVDTYNNFGSELRLIHTYDLLGNPNNLLVGVRYYQGKTNRKQGDGSDDSDANFEFNNPNDLEHSEFDFPSQNVALFAENVFQLSPKFSITPGIRGEYINTQTDGYYKFRVTDLAGNIIADTNIRDNKVSERSFLLGGIGASYKLKKGREVYANVSQNYRAINFNDMRVNNPNLRVDPNLSDENGYSMDVGFRGGLQDKLIFDVSAFYLNYNNRIGAVYMRDEQTYRIYRFRTNIADSRNYGLEAYTELEILKCLGKESKSIGLKWFVNGTIQDARYINSEEAAYQNKRVENVPNFLLKTGLSANWKDIKIAYQFSYTSKQYSDATNTEYTSTAVIGEIPQYWVMDLSASYKIKWFKVSGGLNNLTNNSYFTRRAEGYPGPGIIPADPINFYLTLGVNF
ncbi:MAG: iron(III) dicitrate transport protein FecA [Crocinitomicaceae bacterium]|nr:iron(III) dicitrate transport protein FecA [Crocinitomicaceae bacterium]|tara:strand:- start:17185 stop:19602 length:2418 start_codon:yes stop_codon:yes gene_type:complete